MKIESEKFRDNLEQASKVDLHVVHCSIPNQMEGYLEDAVDSSVEGVDVKVTVYCPGENLDDMQLIEKNMGCYWPVDATLNYIRDKVFGNNSILLASPLVVDVLSGEKKNLLEQETATVVKELPGLTPSLQIETLPGNIISGMLEWGDSCNQDIKFEQELFAESMRKVMLGIANIYLKKLEEVLDRNSNNLLVESELEKSRKYIRKLLMNKNWWREG